MREVLDLRDDAVRDLEHAETVHHGPRMEGDEDLVSTVQLTEVGVPREPELVRPGEEGRNVDSIADLRGRAEGVHGLPIEVRLQRRARADASVIV